MVWKSLRVRESHLVRDVRIRVGLSPKEKHGDEDERAECTSNTLFLWAELNRIGQRRELAKVGIVGQLQIEFADFETTEADDVPE